MFWQSARPTAIADPAIIFWLSLMFMWQTCAARSLLSSEPRQDDGKLVVAAGGAMADHFMETTNLRIGELETKVETLDKKVDGLGHKLDAMDADIKASFAEMREVIVDRYTILQQRIEQ